MKARQLILEEFTPYRVSRLANEISTVLLRVYGPTYKLSVPQWRMLAAVHQLQPTTVSDLTEYSAMEKMTVARAVTDLQKRGIMERQVDARDRRRAFITLTREGERVHGEISDLALSFEEELLSVLEADEVRHLNNMVDRLIDKLALIRRGSMARFAPGR